MISKNGEDQIKRVNEILQDASDYSKVIADNMTWELSLPDYQRLLLEDAFLEYQSRILGVSVEEVSRLQVIRNTYRDLLDYYNESNAFKKIYDFDENMSFDEACRSYCHCDKDTAKKVYELITKINKNINYCKKDIREQHESIPLDRININKDEYVELLMNQDKDFIKEIDDMLREYGLLEFEKRDNQNNGYQR